jgi:hypothetical protein
MLIGARTLLEGFPNMRIFTRNLGLLAVGLGIVQSVGPTLARAQIVCPQMPSSVTTVNRDIRNDFSLQIGALGRIKLGEITNKTEVVAKNLLNKHPTLDKIVALELMSATYCSLIRQSKIPDAEKLDRWERFYEAVLGVKTSAPKVSPQLPSNVSRPQSPPSKPSTPNVPAGPTSIQGANNNGIQVGVNTGSIVVIPTAPSPSYKIDKGELLKNLSDSAPQSCAQTLGVVRLEMGPAARTSIESDGLLLETLRILVMKSNCFVVVDRSLERAAIEEERMLARNSAPQRDRTIMADYILSTRVLNSLGTTSANPDALVSLSLIDVRTGIVMARSLGIPELARMQKIFRNKNLKFAKEEQEVAATAMGYQEIVQTMENYRSDAKARRPNG